MAAFRPHSRIEKAYGRDFRCPAREFAVFISEFSASVQTPGVAYRNRAAQQLRQSHQIVGSGIQREHPADPLGASVASLAEAGDDFIQPNTSSIRLRFFRLMP
jgi:hypothetical protein